MPKERLIVILGPTAVGKTALSLELAAALQTEIISGDALLVYRGFDIGTAKPSHAERRGIVHHLIDIMPPSEPYTVTLFQQQAAACIHQLNAAGKIPILAGGTGLYVKALLEGYTFNQAAGHAEFRTAMEELAAHEGTAAVYARLQAADPETAAELDPHNLRRVIRALETLTYVGERSSRERQADGTAESLVYDALVIGLRRERAGLYARINRRVEQMFAAGLVAEVRGLLAQGVTPDMPAMQGIGYRETAAYLAGELTQAQAIEQIQLHTRHFAKRQLTWYRKMPYIHWFAADELTPEQLLANVQQAVAGFFPTTAK